MRVMRHTRLQTVAETSSKKSFAKCLVCNSYPPLHTHTDSQVVTSFTLGKLFFIKWQQNLCLDAAKFLSKRKKIFIKSQQNFYQDATNVPSRQKFIYEIFKINI